MPKRRLTRDGRGAFPLANERRSGAANTKKIAVDILSIIALLTAFISGCGTPALGGIYTSATLGLSMRYPQDWIYEDRGEQVIFGTSEEIIRGAELETGAAMLVMGSILGDPPTAEEMVEIVLSELPFKDVEISDPKLRMIGGQHGALVTMEGTPEGAGVRIKGFVVGVEHEGRGYLFVAASTLDEWSGYGPVLETMLGSVSFESTGPTTQPTVTPLSPMPPPSPVAEAKSLVIDTDMAVDDWMAILYLLQRPDVQVEAITVTGAGEAHCDPGTRNALGLLSLAGNADVPGSCGRETPLQGNHVFPTSWRHLVDSMLGLPLLSNPNPPSSQTAVELLTSVVQGSPEKVVLVALGPLTNVAEALQNEPSLVENLEMIYIMGGAVDVPGNLQVPGVEIDNSVAEWNIYVDPHAAAVVFQSGAPITLVALDATDDAPVTMDFYRRLEADRATPEAEFVYRVLSQMQDFINSGEYFFWDPLAAAVATDESLATIQAQTLRVIEEEGPESGRTLVAEDGSNIRVCTDADSARFEELFLDTLNGRVP